MKNIKLYEEFNFFRKSKELDKEILEIINDIKKNFDANNLVSEHEGTFERGSCYFNYNYKGQAFRVGYRYFFNGFQIGFSQYWNITLNGESLKENVSKYIIEKFYKYLRDKIKENRKNEQKDKLKRLKGAQGYIGNSEQDPYNEENWL
jgi:hypothetical protein